MDVRVFNIRIEILEFSVYLSKPQNRNIYLIKAINAKGDQKEKNE